MPRTKNHIIAVLLIVIVIQSVGLVYLWMAAPTPVTEEKDTLIVGTTFEIGRVPHPQTVHGGDDPIVNAIFEGLFGYVGTTLEIEPVLSIDMGAVSTDGLEYTFTLRQGVKFHDGTSFNATAVKDHFDRMFDIGLGMTYIFIDGLLNKTEIIDTYTVKLTLNFPNSDFLHTLCHLTAMIPSPTVTLMYIDSLNDHPVGTGPFKYVSKIIDNEVVMERNDDWWQLAQGKEITIDELVFVQISDPSTMKLAIERGDIHATDGRFHIVDYSSLLANTELTTYDTSSSSSQRWLTFNMNASVWDYFPNKAMRQAFAYAIPYDEIISVGLSGLGERLYSFLPPEYIGYKKVFNYNYNPTKALELIAEAGFTAPVAVNLHITPTHYGVTEPDIATLIQTYAADAGFTVTIHQEEYGAYKAAYKTTATQEMNMWAWYPNYPSTDDWATTFMSSVGWATGYSHAISGDMAAIYPYADNLIVEAAGTTNETRKIEILEELQDLWVEYVPNIMTWREVTYQFTLATVTGAVYGATKWDIHYHNVVIG